MSQRIDIVQNHFKYFLKYIWHIHGTQTATIIQSLSEPGSNDNSDITLNSLELQNRNLIIRCSLVSYPGHPVLWVLNYLQQMHSISCKDIYII